LDALREFIPEDIKFGIVEDQGVYVRNAIDSVQNSLIMAAILVIIVTYCFLGSWRQILVLIVALPLTLIANFIFMWLAGFSLNIFSLGGLVVAMGVVLDNSIVAVENISRLKASGNKLYSLEGIKQITSPMVAATLSFLALVFPFLLVPGITTLLFKELIMAIAGIVVISLFIAWTITPLMLDFLLRRHKASSVPSFADRANDFVGAEYRALLERLLRIKYKVIIFFILLIVFCITLKVGTEFLPRIDDGRIMVKLKMPAGTSVGRVDKILKKVEKELEGDQTIAGMFTLSGGKVWGLYTYEIASEGEVDIQLVTKGNRKISTDDFIKKIMGKVKKAVAPGAKMPVKHMKIKGIRQQGEQEVEVKIKGTDINEIYAYAKKVAAALNQNNNLSGVNISMDMTKPEYRIYIDRAKAAYLGVPVKAVAETLQALVHGIVPTRLRDGAEYYDIRIKVPETGIKSKQDLENLLIESKDGKKFFVKEIADVRRSVGPIEIVRENQAKMVVVRADARDVSVGKAVELVENMLKHIDKPSGIFYEMGGQAQMMREMKKTTVLVLIFAVFFAFVVLAVQFESLKLPFLVLLSLPPVLAGMLVGLKIMGLALGATVAIGALVAISATVNDGVLLLSFAEELRKTRSYSKIKAISEAAATRLRPRMMTTFSTIAGFIPLAMNWGEGGDLLQPMAVAAISGLFFEIFVTLFLLPCIYCFREK
jgi:multidrug efflux pump subunit AcrB